MIRTLGALAAVVCLLLAASCAASPPARTATRPEPVPPDPEAITIFGRYQPSLESLAPAGVEIGDLTMVDGRLLIHIHADDAGTGKAFARALERSGWYRDARHEAVEPGRLRPGESLLSVQPQP